jgi:hypothetical protein
MTLLIKPHTCGPYCEPVWCSPLLYIPLPKSVLPIFSLEVYGQVMRRSSCPCVLLLLSIPFWCDQPNNLRRKRLVMKILITHFFPTSFLSRDWRHYITLTCKSTGRPQWPHGLRQEPSSPARTLGMWVRIPLEAWMSVCVYSVFVLFCV